jgi:hypothetical protein
MAAWKAGVSAIFRRTYKPSATSTALTRNGTRQPQLRNCASLNDKASAKNRPLDARKPIDGPSCGNMPNQPRLPAGAFSVASSAAPPHSPPSPMPWPKRNTHKRIGARLPIES